MAGNSEGQKKGAITRKQKDVDAFRKMGKLGNAANKGGYFRKLKNEGRIEELRAISQKGVAAHQVAQSQRQREAERTKSGS